MNRSGEFLMTSLSEIKNVQWLKLVNYTSEQCRKWSYGEKDCSKRGYKFDLHWALNESQKANSTKAQLDKANERKLEE